MQSRITLDQFNQAMANLDDSDQHFATIHQYLQENMSEFEEGENKHEEKRNPDELITMLNTTFTPSGETALTAAVKATMDGNRLAFPLLQTMLKIPGIINAPNLENKTPLFLAVNYQPNKPHVGMISMLLQDAKNIDVPDELLKQLQKKRDEATKKWPRQVLEAGKLLYTFIKDPNVHSVVTEQEFKKALGKFLKHKVGEEPQSIAKWQKEMMSFFSDYRNVEKYLLSLMRQCDIPLQGAGLQLYWALREPEPEASLQRKAFLTGIKSNFIKQLCEHGSFQLFLRDCEQANTPKFVTFDSGKEVNFYEEAAPSAGYYDSLFSPSPANSPPPTPSSSSSSVGSPRNAVSPSASSSSTVTPPVSPAAQVERGSFATLKAKRPTPVSSSSNVSPEPGFETPPSSPTSGGMFNPELEERRKKMEKDRSKLTNNSPEKPQGGFERKNT